MIQIKMQNAFTEETTIQSIQAAIEKANLEHADIDARLNAIPKEIAAVWDDHKRREKLELEHAQLDARRKGLQARIDGLLEAQQQAMHQALFAEYAANLERDKELEAAQLINREKMDALRAEIKELERQHKQVLGSERTVLMHRREDIARQFLGKTNPVNFERDYAEQLKAVKNGK